MQINEIINYLKQNKSELNYALSVLLMDETISISELVNLKEMAMKRRLLDDKQYLSDASALLVRHIDKIGLKTLKEDTKKFVNEQGFIKI